MNALAHAQYLNITPETVPEDEAELLACLASWEWRIYSGQLYKITTKGDDDPDDDEPETAVPFRPNPAQTLLLGNLHNRNNILKARQMGFSTLIEILCLDQALFNENQECVVISHTKDAATKLYRKKICFAYDNLPVFVRNLIPYTARSQTQIVFANGSSIEVTSSARGGTPHFLHISEMGKIAAKNPEKALEITTGSLQGVPKSGFVFIESTAEGQSGTFYEITKRSERLKAAGKILIETDFRFQFFAWWQQPEYRMPATGVTISSRDHEYFDDVEVKMDCVIDLEQRAWYISKRDNDFPAHPHMMWREYPSTPEECWQSSTEGYYYARVLMTARKEGRIGFVPIITGHPVNSYWDVGATDSTAIWLAQHLPNQDRFIRFREDQDEGYMSMILWMESLGIVWGTHFLPHDAGNKHKGIENTNSAVFQLRLIRPTWDWRVVPRIGNLQHGIDMVRLDFSSYWFDEEGCKEGLEHIQNYRRVWNSQLNCWGNEPMHNEHSHGADALRQKATGYRPTSYDARKTDAAANGRRRKRSGAMTA